jgi:hypothetical protein
MVRRGHRTNARIHGPYKSLARSPLTVGYNKILKASLEISEEDLRSARGNYDVKQKLYMNPLQEFMLGLVDMFESESEESQSLEREKSAIPALIAYEATRTVASDGADFSTPSARPLSQPPPSYSTPSKKRPISQTSFDAHSTESTPNKLVQPEVKVQALQNTFVRTVINQLWLGDIPIRWASGRKMFLTYTEFFPFLY